MLAPGRRNVREGPEHNTGLYKTYNIVYVATFLYITFVRKYKKRMKEFEA